MRPREHIRYEIVPIVVGDFCWVNQFGVLQKELVNKYMMDMNGQVVFKSSTYSLDDWHA